MKSVYRHTTYIERDIFTIIYIYIYIYALTSKLFYLK